MPLLNHNDLKASQFDQYIIDLEFVTRTNAGAVTIAGPDYGSDVVYARTGNGVYTITFAAHLRPFIARCWANLAENSNVTANVEYVPATGVATVRLWAQGGGADNTDLLNVQVFFLASRNSQTK